MTNSWEESAEGHRPLDFDSKLASLPSQDEAESPRGLDPSLLERVLEKTLDVGESTEALDGTLRAAVLSYFAQNGRGAEFSESLLADLVRIVLSHEMAVVVAQPCGQAISEQVARSIWDDPSARGRISALWRLWQLPSPPEPAANSQDTVGLRTEGRKT
jgi:hypothetical protein